MKQMSILLAFVFVLASCTGAEEKEAVEIATPIVETEAVEETKKEMLAEVAVDPSLEEKAMEDDVMMEKAEEKMDDTMMEDKMKKHDENMEGETMMKKEEVAVEEVIEKEIVAGSYAEYSESAMKAAKGNKVLFFAASWCPSCNAADKNLKADTIADGLSVFKVDYDSSTDLRKKYGVTSQHTFVLVDDNMEKIKLMVGGSNSADIVNGLLK